MRKNIQINRNLRLALKGLFAMSLTLMMTSCVMQTGAYTETDGVYYNPNTDTLPEGYATNDGNQLGQDYNYQDQSIIQKSQENQDLKNKRYDSWNSSPTDSDWGNFAGTETNFDLYSNYGFYPYYGYGNPYWNFGYSSYFGYIPFGGYYSPYGFYGNYYGGFGNYYGGYYGGFGNYYGYGGYGNYYGDYGNHNYYYNPYQYKRSGVNGGGLNNGSRVNRYSNADRLNTNAGFRGTNYNNQTPVRYRNDGNMQNSTRQQQYQQRRYQSNQPMRNRNQDYQPQRSEPSYQPRNNSSNDGGFRSGSNGGGFNGGGSTRSSGGGFRR